MGSLRFSERVARTTWRVVPKRALSGAIGWAAGRHIPSALRSAVLHRFASHYGIDASEAEKSLSEYARVDDFFTRRLQPGARPVDASSRAVVSPADGTVVETGLVVEGHLLQVKGALLALDELLADAEAARRLEGGPYLTTYLSPQDYHRVHAPAGGRIVGWRHIPGTLFPVGARSVSREPALFIQNERLVTLVEGDADVGFYALIMVAAVGVGNITAAYDDAIETHGASFLRAGVRQGRYDPGKPLAKGEELGTFHMGSTTIAVFEAGRVELFRSSSGQTTRMGQSIGTVCASRVASA